MKKLLSVFLCVMMVLLMSVTPAALAQEEELSKDVTINVYSWWDPTKVGMVNLKEGFEKKYADNGKDPVFFSTGRVETVGQPCL